MKLSKQVPDSSLLQLPEDYSNEELFMKPKPEPYHHPDLWPCPIDGTPIPPNNKECPYCGRPVEELETM